MNRQQINQKLQERAKLIQRVREIYEQADGENRDFTAEEQAEIERIQNETTKIKEQCDRWEAQLRLESELEESRNRSTQPASPQKSMNLNEEQRYNDLLNRYHDGGSDALTSEEKHDLSRQVFKRFLRFGETELSFVEKRALQADAATAGGFVLAPQQFVNELIQDIDDMVWVRQWARVIGMERAQSLGVPTLESDPSDPTWTSELAIGSEDSTMEFGKRELHPHPLAKYIKVSEDLLRQAPDVEELVRERLAYKQAIAQENAFLNGSGDKQPLGVFVANANGITTARDVSDGNTQTSITFDGLKAAKSAVSDYPNDRLRWLFHRDAILQISRLKDGEGQYIWRESVQIGEPDRISGVPVYASKYVPNTFTAGNYVGIIGDFSNYWIADAFEMAIKRLVELFAGSNQIGLVLRVKTDGQPVNQNAFARVQLAS